MKRFFCAVIFLFISLLVNPFAAVALTPDEVEQLIEQEKQILAERQHEVIVQYKEGRQQQARLRVMDHISSINKVSPGIEVLRVKDEQQVQTVVEQLKQSDFVQHVEINQRSYLPQTAAAGLLPAAEDIVMNDRYYYQQWWLPAVNAPAAWQAAVPKRPAVVAVIDSGMETDHEDLVNRIAPGGYNFVRNSNYVYDLLGHGTAVSGIIAAEANNYKGICGVAGWWDVKVLPLQAAYHDGSLYTSDIIAAIDYAIEQKVDVINMSLGGGYSRLEEQAVQRALDRGIVVVAAAGNDGARYYEYPASYAGVISVGSIGREGYVSDFSNYNDQVDFVAPGEEIATTGLGNNYVYAGGTSFSTPIVSGVATMMKAVDAALTPQQVRDKLAATAVDKGQPSKDVYYGYGLIDAGAVLSELVKVPVSGVLLPSPLTLEVGQTAQLTATIVPSNATDQQVHWFSDRPQVAVVDRNGQVTAVGPGKATIVVKTNDGGKTAACAVEVKDTGFQIWPTQTGVPADKQWTVNFNLPLDLDTVHNKNIYVTDAAGNSLNVRVQLNGNGKSVLVTPLIPYVPGQVYYLHIDTTVQSTTGSALKEPFKMCFEVE